MKTKQEIEERLKKVQSDVRLTYPAANVFSNAPLALIQTSLEQEVSVLSWVLKE